MLDTIVWTAIFVGLFLGIVLICIDLLEEWKLYVGGIVDAPPENPTAQLKRVAQQLGRAQPRSNFVG